MVPLEEEVVIIGVIDAAQSADGAMLSRLNKMS